MKIRPVVSGCLKKFRFPIYIGLVIFVVLALNYYEVPKESHASSSVGTVSITIQRATEQVCGNGICESSETTSSCCTDCGCQDWYSCTDNVCVYGGGIKAVSYPKFKISPENSTLFIHENKTQGLNFSVKNIDTTRINIKLSSENASLISLNQTYFMLEPNQEDEFILNIIPYSLKIGNYTTRVVGKSGSVTKYAVLNIAVVGLGEKEAWVFAKVPVKAHFEFIWLVIPISAAIILYYYTKSKNFKFK